LLSIPEIRKGRPCIAGSGVSVRRIAGWYNLGLTPEEIAAKIEHLSLAQIHAALTYYHANRDEIDSDIAVEDAAIEKYSHTRETALSVLRLYLDEDAMDGDLVRGLRSRGIDVVTAADARMIRRKDEEHHSWATLRGRALYSFNVGD